VKSLNPEPVRARGAELPVDPIQRARCGFVADRRPQALAANNAVQPKGFHQPLNIASGRIETFPAQLPPYLPGAIDGKIFRKNALYFRREFTVALRPLRQPGRILPPGRTLMIGRRGDRQQLADRLDPEGSAMMVN
jgi:hypothetical protein